MDEVILRQQLEDKESHFNAYCSVINVGLTVAKTCSRFSVITEKLGKYKALPSSTITRMLRKVVGDLTEDFQLKAEILDVMLWPYVVAWSLSKARDDEPDGEREPRVAARLLELFAEAYDKDNRVQMEVRAQRARLEEQAGKRDDEQEGDLVREQQAPSQKQVKPRRCEQRWRPR